MLSNIVDGLIFVLLTIVLVFVLSFTYCCDAPGGQVNERTQETLDAYGFTNPRSTGKPWLQCSDSDSFWFSETFCATNTQGREVCGAVCCGIWKNCAVRF